MDVEFRDGTHITHVNERVVGDFRIYNERRRNGGFTRVHRNACKEHLVGGFLSFIFLPVGLNDYAHALPLESEIDTCTSDRTLLSLGKVAVFNPPRERSVDNYGISTNKTARCNC